MENDKLLEEKLKDPKFAAAVLNCITATSADSQERIKIVEIILGWDVVDLARLVSGILYEQALKWKKPDKKT